MAKRKIKVKKIVSAHIDVISNISEGDNGIIRQPIWQSKEKIDGEKFLLDTKIIQVDTEKRLANYVIQEAGIVNFSKRYWTADVLEKTCNEFSIHSGATGTNRLHYEDKKTGEVYSEPSKALITQNFMLYGSGDPRYPKVKTPAWVQQWYYPPEADDEMREAKNGKVAQLSCQGIGVIQKVEIEIDEEFIMQDKDENNEDNESLEQKVGAIQKFLRTIGFGDKKETDQNNIREEEMNKEQYDNMITKFDSLLEALEANKSETDSKVKAIEDSVEQTIQTKVKEIKQSLSDELKKEINENEKLIAQKNADTNVSVSDENAEDLKAVFQTALGVKVKTEVK